MRRKKVGSTVEAPVLTLMLREGQGGHSSLTHRALTAGGGSTHSPVSTPAPVGGRAQIQAIPRGCATSEAGLKSECPRGCVTPRCIQPWALCKPSACRRSEQSWCFPCLGRSGCRPWELAPADARLGSGLTQQRPQQVQVHDCGRPGPQLSSSAPADLCWWFCKHTI